MSKKFSIFIPVYKESNFLANLLDSLIADPYPEKEIFVVVDEPTEKSLSLAKKFEKVHFIWNGERKGKVNVLNEIVDRSTGEYLLFLDSDVLLNGNSNNFLETIASGIKEAEIVEVKKEIMRDSFLARIVSYDYLSFNFTNWFFSRKLNKCLGLNGAAFAIRRETFLSLGGFRRVIVEDLDIGTRAFIKGVRYKFVKNLGVYTRAPPSWESWFDQRKRWAIGTALWFKEYFKDLLRIVRAHPGVLLPSLLFIFPCLPFFLVTLFTPDELYVKAFYIALLFLSTQASLLLPPTAFTSTSLAVFRNLFLMIGSFGTYSFVFYLLARKLGCYFNPAEFAIFYLIYSPLWLLMIIASITKVYFKQKEVDINWKV